MALTNSSAPTAAPAWRGFHHVALVTPDLDATIAFYQNVLGMQIGEIAPATNYGGRHCFIKPGVAETWGLHVFEQANAQLFPYPEGMPRGVFVPGALQHVAFALPSETDALALRERLATFGVPTTPISDLGQVRNMLFRDNNGTLLEATWSKTEGNQEQFEASDEEPLP
jgi:catechol 2,3-dioxygenase-like lactoylglutathione lyase family enzyme